jgi:hypothetical protein
LLLTSPFKRNDALRYLLLQHNRLEQLPETMGNLRNLTPLCQTLGKHTTRCGKPRGFQGKSSRMVDFPHLC